MVHLLHIDTSGDIGHIALSTDGVIISSITNNDTRNHAASINHQISLVLSEAGIEMAELDAIVVCGGPGSYTGLRIGLATAKGLCYILDKPLMLHSTLKLLTLAPFYEYLNKYDVYSVVMPARDAEYYFASYSNNLKTTIEPTHVFEKDLELLKNKMVGKMLLTGNINNAIYNLFSLPDAFLFQNSNIDIQSWAKYSYEQYNCNGFVNLEYAEPFYLKPVYTHNSKKIS